MSEGAIFDIQRFAVHDGPGIRSTVFFKGCSCRCAWCHNPESLIARPQVEFYPSRCIACGKCFALCPEGAHQLIEEKHRIDRKLCAGCGNCVEGCYADALVRKGRKASHEEVMRTLLADRAYYIESGGGVTLSGGEPALQGEFALDLLRELKGEGIHTAIQTAGNYPFANLAPLLPYLDLVMYDIKGFAQSVYAWHVHGDRGTIFDNLAALAEGFGGEIAVRTPVVGPVNDSPEEIGEIARMLGRMRNISYYQLMPYHGLGKTKYDALDQEFASGYYTPPPERMAELEAVAARYIPVYNHEKGLIQSH